MTKQLLSLWILMLVSNFVVSQKPLPLSRSAVELAALPIANVNRTPQRPAELHGTSSPSKAFPQRSSDHTTGTPDAKQQTCGTGTPQDCGTTPLDVARSDTPNLLSPDQRDSGEFPKSPARPFIPCSAARRLTFQD